MSTEPPRRRWAGWARSLALSLVVLAALAAWGQEGVQVPPPEEPDVLPGEPGAADLPAVDEGDDDGRLEGSYFASSLATSAGWQEGFLLGDEEEGDAVFRLVPRLLLVHRPSGRTELTVAYAPELESFERHSDLDAVHHAGGALFRHDFTRRSSVLAGGSLLDGEDPTRQLGGLAVLLPRVPYTQTRLYTGLEHRWQRTFALVHVGQTRTEIEPGPGVLAAGVDETETAASLTLLRSLTDRTDLSASYSYVDPTSRTPVAPDPGENGGEGGGPAPVRRLDDPLQTLTLGLGHRFSERLALQLSGGVLDQRDELSWVGAAEVVRRGDPLSLSVRYDRSLLSLGAPSAVGEGVPVQPGTPTAALDDTITDSLSLGFLARLTDRVRWYQTAEGSRTDLATGETLETLGATARLVVDASRRIGTFLELDYLDQRGSDLFGEPASRWGAALGLIVGVSGPPAAWGVREEPQELNATLPGRTGGFDG